MKIAADRPKQKRVGHVNKEDAEGCTVENEDSLNDLGGNNNKIEK